MAAATLTSPAAAPTGTTTASLTLTSNQATGTVYAVITDVVTTPSHAQIVAGQNNTGGAALWAGNQAAALSNTFLVTGFRNTARLYAHFTQVNGTAENSTPGTSAAWWLDGVRFGTFTANATSSVVTVEGYPFLRASGTFGGGTVTYQYQDDGGNWVNITSGAFTTATQLVVNFARPVRIRGVLTASTTPTIAWEIR